VTGTSDADLYRRGGRTLVGSWQAYARGLAGAAVHVRPGGSVAVFPDEPERSIYNNALIEDATAVDPMERDYAAAGVGHFAAWAHETDRPLRAELGRRGYTLDTTTRAMGLHLDDIHRPRPDAELGPADWAEYLAATGLPPDLLRAADHAAFHVLVARADGAVVAAALAYDRDGDCGIYNVWTRPDARGRGLGTALTVAQAHAGRERGCRTASLQSTPMAERMYASVGFRDLGRILEYVPAVIHSGRS
jgi:GNAT superfamily N-acetyltransferase